MKYAHKGRGWRSMDLVDAVAPSVYRDLCSLSWPRWGLA